MGSGIRQGNLPQKQTLRQRYRSWCVEEAMPQVAYSKQELGVLYQTLTQNGPPESRTLNRWNKAAQMALKLQREFEFANRDPTPSTNPHRPSETQVLTWNEIKQNERYATEFYCLTMALSDLAIGLRLAPQLPEAMPTPQQALAPTPGFLEVSIIQLLTRVLAEESALGLTGSFGLGVGIGAGMLLLEEAIGRRIESILSLATHPGPWAGIDKPGTEISLAIGALERQVQEFSAAHLKLLWQVQQILNSAPTLSLDLRTSTVSPDDPSLENVRDDQLCGLYLAIISALLDKA